MAIVRVQSKTANSGAGSVSTLNVVFDSTPTAGNIIVVAACGNGTSSIPGGAAAITGTNIFFTSPDIAAQGSSASTTIIAVGRCLASVSATVTATFTTAGGIAIAAAEYSGCSMNMDQFIGATATGTAVASGTTGTTETANELWVAALGIRLSGGATFSSPTNSFSIVGQDKSALSTTSDRSVALLERIVTGTGTPNAGATASGSGVWVAQLITLEEAVAASGGICVPTLTFGAEGVAVAA